MTVLVVRDGEIFDGLDPIGVGKELQLRDLFRRHVLQPLLELRDARPPHIHFVCQQSGEVDAGGPRFHLLKPLADAADLAPERFHFLDGLTQLTDLSSQFHQFTEFCVVERMGTLHLGDVIRQEFVL